MSPEDVAAWALAFAALGHPTRLRIFLFLDAAGPEGANVSTIADAVAARGATLSHHLAALRRAGVLRSDRQERFLYYRIAPQAVALGAILRQP